ncbi:DUF4143 domain-containing protein [uncultured Varibaculum sp.]|uniref:ATP-binding protein n=1 Tax=uncultured Varibaculum sp. TaxID=413896 RepID=UPI0027D95F79|nr:DUF4143 domain-containing protein [uncultured Varibaculum sp.]
MSDYLKRVIDYEIAQVFPQLPALCIAGAKGVGKTETAQRLARTTYQLDQVDTRTILQADPRLFLQQPPPVLLDEWQLLPETWDTVRRAVDNGAPPESFLLTGSASPKPGVQTHSGAGRIITLRMRPLTLSERGIATPTVSLRGLFAGEEAVTGSSDLTASDYADAICQTGLPGFQQLTGRALRLAVDSYLRDLMDKDIFAQGYFTRTPHTLRAWLRSYAQATATTASYAQILEGATAGEGDKPSSETTRTYRDFLTKLWILEPLEAWQPLGSGWKRLTSSPKHHLVDPGFAARLLDLESQDLLTPAGANMYGALFESLAVLCVRVFAQALEATVGHFRTRAGEHEVDLVLQGRGGAIVALEVKTANRVSDHDVKHLLWLRKRVGQKMRAAAVLYGGKQAYMRKDGIAVIPLGCLGV